MASCTNEKLEGYETLLAVLCDERNPWTWGSLNQCCINFSSNGTGGILCGAGLRIVLAVEFDWKFVNPESPTEGERIAYKGTGSATLWGFKMEITLTTRIHPIYRNEDQWGQSQAQTSPSDESAPCRWAPVAKEAFRPKRYSLRLEKGKFIEPFHKLHKNPYPLFQSDPYRFAPDRYVYRLSFDTSPYPARDEWRPEYAMQPSGLEACLHNCRFWKYREFVWQLIPKSEQTWAETLGLDWWLSPSTGADPLGD